MTILTLLVLSVPLGAFMFMTGLWLSLLCSYCLKRVLAHA
jgi:hypothetical protein